MPNESLKIEYPESLEKTDFGSSHFKFLLPYILGKNEFYKRNDIIELAVKIHIELSGKEVSKSTEQLGHKLKGFIKKSTVLRRDPHTFGIYEYIGESRAGKGKSEKQNLIAYNRTDTHLTSNSVNPRKLIEGKHTGDETFYVWWNKDSETVALSKKQKEWAMKIGKHNSRDVNARLQDYKTSIPHTPVVGLLVHTKKAITLEKIVIATLTNRKKHINQMGVEWFETSVDEIESILKFNELI